MDVQAKMRVIRKTATDNGAAPGGSRYTGVEVTLHPVYSDDKSNPNYTWSQATPSGEVRLYISNPAAHEAFELGKTYLVTFAPVPE
jgi:hypothetical protein